MTIFSDPNEDAPLLSGLSLPDDADAVLDDPVYRTERVCAALLDQSDIIAFVDPSGGLKVARAAAKLSDLLGLSPEVWLRYKGRCLSVVASRHRALGELQKADDGFWIALALHVKFPLLPLEEGDLHRRLAFLRNDQNRLREAMIEAETCRRIFLAHGGTDRHIYGCALACRGNVHYRSKNLGAAVADFRKALGILDPRRGFIYYSAAHNLGLALVDLGKDTAGAARELQQVQEMGEFPEDSLPRLYLYWTQSRLFIQLDDVESAEEGLTRSRAGFRKLGVPFEETMTSLDLAALLCAQGRLGEVWQIAREMFPLFAKFKAMGRAYDALRLFYRAANSRTVTTEKITEVRNTVSLAMGCIA